FSTVRSNGRPDIRIYYAIPGQGTDISAFQLISPSSGVSRGAVTPVKARFANLAGNAVTSMQLNYQLGNNTPVTENWTGTLNTGEYIDYEFTTQLTMPQSHTANLKVWVNNVNNGGADDVGTNDTLGLH